MSLYQTLFPASCLSRGMFLLTSITIFGSYFIAVSKGDVLPFPNTTITATAVNYPQYIIFRVGNLVVTPILALVYAICYLWLENQKKKLEQAFSIAQGIAVPSIPKAILILGLIAALAFSISIASISDGQMNDSIHLSSTYIYFSTTLINFTVITYKIYQLRALDPSTCSNKSYYIKCGVLGCYFFMFIFIGYGLEHMGLTPNAKFMSVLEWTFVLLLGLFLYSFSYDFEQLNICLQDMSFRSDINKNQIMSLSEMQYSYRTDLNKPFAQLIN
jgi:hypothetical protein